MHEFDVVVLGGGLAGLSLSIGLQQQGFAVALVERKHYPFHKVCGEYISKETLPFLNRLGFDPFAQGAVDIQQLRVTAPSGRALDMQLDLGGFGLSRHKMDHALWQLGTQAGVTFFLGEQVQRIEPETQTVTTNQRTLKGRMLVGAFGKRSTVDRELNRDFLQKRSPFVAVKYHLDLEHPEDLIELHNFKDGYCGVSRVEDGRTCLCYLTTRANLRKAGKIPAMEAAVLAKNPHLAAIFDKAKHLYERPQVINEVSFAPKPLVEQGLLMCGDAAGMIAPLCGNGMAMALHSAHILTGYLADYLHGKLDRSQLEAQYRKAWSAQFARRLWIGRNVQSLFGAETMTEVAVWSFGRLPWLARWVVANTHGQPF